MGDVRALFGEFLKIQKRQNDLLKEIADKSDLLQFRRGSIEFGAHMRNCHNSQFDSIIDVREHNVINREVVLLNNQYQQNQERLEELRKQLFAEVS